MNHLTMQCLNGEDAARYFLEQCRSFLSHEFVFWFSLNHRFSGQRFQDGVAGGWSGAGPGAAGAEDGHPEENLHQVDEQRVCQ